MKRIIAILLFIFSFQIFAQEAFLDPTLRPCDPELAASWTYTPVPAIAPDSPKLPFRCEGKIKVFEITAEEVFSNFDNGWEAGRIYTWGYNGSNPGPVIEAMEGETIKVIVTNKLPEPTTVHWHGFELPFNMDGASGHSQKPIMPGEKFEYSWTINQSGTYMYHSGHMIAKQLAMGLAGFFVVHPKKKPAILVDQDVLLFLQMWTLPPHSILPDTMNMMFNYFTINGKSAPLTSPIDTLIGQKVRIRFANISMMQHPIHLHGHTWKVVASGAGDNEPSAFTTGNTILVPVGQTLDVIVDKIDEPGDWMFHCHLPHHVTNNMDINPVPGEMMNHGDAGMHTLFKVRKEGEPDLPDHTGHTMPMPTGDDDDHTGHAMGPKVGIYEGTLKLENKKSFKIMLEVEKVQEDAEWRKLEATLKIVFGPSEYILYHYEKIRFNWKTGALLFDTDNKGVVLNSLNFMNHGGKEMLMGKAKIDFTGLEGTINLDYVPNGQTFNTDITSNKFQPELSGEYQAVCKEKDTIISIYSGRGLNDSLMSGGNPFFHYLIKGQIAQKRDETFRVESTIEGGVYDPFSGNLNLRAEKAGISFALSCNQSLDENKESILTCDDQCSYKKIARNQQAEIVKKEIKFKSIIGTKVSQLSTLKEIGGDFEGKLLHTSIDSVQNIRFKVIPQAYSNKPMELSFPFVASALHLDIGAGKEISYKFEVRPWLDSTSKFTAGKNSLLLKGNSKVYLIVSTWKVDSIEGVLYHEDFGRVGPFLVVRKKSGKVIEYENEIPSTFQSIAENFENESYKLSLKSTTLDRDELESGNPFYPLHFIGTLENKVTQNLVSFASGSYNFFNKELSLITSDGRLVKGKLTKDGLTLNVPASNQRRVRYIEQNNIISFKQSDSI